MQFKGKIANPTFFNKDTANRKSLVCSFMCVTGFWSISAKGFRFPGHEAPIFRVRRSLNNEVLILPPLSLKIVEVVFCLRKSTYSGKKKSPFCSLQRQTLCHSYSNLHFQPPIIYICTFKPVM